MWCGWLCVFEDGELFLRMVWCDLAWWRSTNFLNVVEVE